MFYSPKYLVVGGQMHALATLVYASTSKCVKCKQHANGRCIMGRDWHKTYMASSGQLWTCL